MGNNLVGKGGSGWYERMYAEWKDPEFNPNMDEVRLSYNLLHELLLYRDNRVCKV